LILSELSNQFSFYIAKEVMRYLYVAVQCYEPYPTIVATIITIPAQNTVSGRGDFVTSLISEVGKESKVTE